MSLTTQCSPTFCRHGPQRASASITTSPTPITAKPFCAHATAAVRERRGMPTTLIGARAPGAGCVMIDDRGAAATATQHLIGLGHRAIGLIYGRETENPLALEHERVLGFRDALSHSGLEPRPEWAVAGGFTVEGGRRAMAQLLQLQEPPSAVFAFSDEMALGALAAIRERGLTPGREVSVVGFDGHDLADLEGLTTVVQPVRRMGELAVELTCAAIDNRTLDVSAHVLPTTLVARSSTGPVNASDPPVQEDF